MADEEDDPTEGDPTDGYRLILPFDSDEPEFTRGFNAGSIYGYLAAMVELRHHMISSLQAAGKTVLPDKGWTLECPFSARPENVEMVMRIAESLGVTAVASSDGVGPGGGHINVAFRIPE